MIVKRTPGLAATLALALIILACATTSAAPALAHLKGVDELKTWFNAGKGHARLILLLSPT